MSTLGIGKACHRSLKDGQITFGTLYEHKGHRCNIQGGPLDNLKLYFFGHGSFEKGLPDGVQALWTASYFWEITFAVHYFFLPMRINAFARHSQDGSHVPVAIAALLSGYLQTGEALNLRNFDKYNEKNPGGLKFLPLLIVPGGIRYYMYDPGLETREKAIARFTEVLNQLKKAGLTDPQRLSAALMNLNALIMFERAASTGGNQEAQEVTQARQALMDVFEGTLGGLKGGSLGFVYQDLRPGNHDTILLTVE